MGLIKLCGLLAVGLFRRCGLISLRIVMMILCLNKLCLKKRCSGMRCLVYGGVELNVTEESGD